MIETLSQTQGKLYSRAVDPAVESRLRARDTQESTPSAANAVYNQQSRVQQERQRQSLYEQTGQVQAQSEQRARDVGEQLSQALRSRNKVRHVTVRPSH